jgi:hypothetical protein
MVAKYFASHCMIPVISNIESYDIFWNRVKITRLDFYAPPMLSI